ncbi:MAG: hypothetical protein ABIJ16_13615 [Bacteroidota bacterium]
MRINRQSHAEGSSVTFINHSYKLNLFSGEEKYITLVRGKIDDVVACP